MASTQTVMWNQIQTATDSLNQAAEAAIAEPVGVETTKAILKTLVETIRVLSLVAHELEGR